MHSTRVFELMKLLVKGSRHVDRWDSLPAHLYLDTVRHLLCLFVSVITSFQQFTPMN